MSDTPITSTSNQHPKTMCDQPIPHAIEAQESAAVSSDRLLARFSVNDLQVFAGARCRDIYNDFTEDEAKRQPRAVFLAWEVGHDLFLHDDFKANA